MTRWRRTSTRCAAPLTSSIERFFLETEDRWSLIRSRLCTCSNDHLFAIKLRRNLHPLVPCMFNIQTRTREAWTLTQGMHGAASSDAESRRLTPLRLSLKAASSPPLPTPHAYSTFQDSRCVKSLAIGSVPRAPTMGGRLHCGLEVYTQLARLVALYTIVVFISVTKGTHFRRRYALGYAAWRRLSRGPVRFLTLPVGSASGHRLRGAASSAEPGCTRKGGAHV